MGANNTVLSIVLQPDGKILIGGSFEGGGEWAETTSLALILIAASNTSFINQNVTNGDVTSIALQADGRY